ncbi:MAG: glucosaminidase domain-containing protein [Rhodospirillaceae bacterium]|nr:glucosaminidase domain-containing protein [Rhodospirillaceae bacterium]
MKTFHWSTLALAAMMISTLVGFAWLEPPAGGAGVPNAVFNAKVTTLGQTLHVRPEARPVEIPTPALKFDVVVVDSLDYDLDAVLSGNSEVPRVLLASLPQNLSTIRTVDRKKEIFFKAVLPLVLQVNEQITNDRQRLWQLKTAKKLGSNIKATDQLWLAVMAERYKTRRGDIDALLARHDIVPPSLAIAQAATESAWGTSRFVREGNAMFGQWTFSDAPGIVPNGREVGQTHRVRAFTSLSASVSAYVTNLNRHRAYKEFRKQRADMRAKGGPIDGYILAAKLYRYSERGASYVSELQSIIESNELRSLDNARLKESDQVI